MNSTKKSFKTMAFTAMLKTILILFNILFLFMGLAFMLIGIYGFKMLKQFFTFAPSTAIYVPILSIGLFMILVGALSLWCIPKGVSSLIYIYAVVVFLLFLSTFTVSLLFISRRDTVETTFKTGIDRMIKVYPNESEAIDLLQSKIKCCGTETYQDWFKTSWANETNSVPESCCQVKADKCRHLNLKNTNASDVYQTGCYTKFSQTIENNYGVISGVLLLSSLIILLGSVLSCILASNFNKNRYVAME